MQDQLVFPLGSNTPKLSAKRVGWSHRRNDKVVGVLYQGEGWGLTAEGLLVRVDRSVSVSASEGRGRDSVQNGSVKVP